MTGTFHISWENLWFPVDFPLSQPSESSNSQLHEPRDPTHQDNSREFFQRLEDLEKSFITGLTEGVLLAEPWVGSPAEAQESGGDH